MEGILARMHRTSRCLWRCRQQQLCVPHSHLRPLHLRRQLLGHSRLFSSRHINTSATTLFAAPSTRTAADDFIEPEPIPAAPEAVDDVVARILHLLNTKHELDGLVLFQRSRHRRLPLSLWNTILATVIRNPFHFSFLHQLPASLLTVSHVGWGGGQHSSSVLASLELFLADLRSHLLQPDAHTYQLCMSVAASAGDWQRVLHWWRDMEQGGLRPTLTIAHHVMAAMKETRQPALIRPYYLAHFVPQHSPHTATTTTITPPDIHTQPGTLRPIPLTFHYLLSAAIQLRDADVTKLWKAMKATHTQSTLDITLLTSYLAHLGSEGKLVEMMTEYTKMKRSAVRPTLLLLSSVLSPLTSEIVALSLPSSSSSSFAAAAPVDASAGRLGRLLSWFNTVLEDITLHSGLSANNGSDAISLRSSTPSTRLTSSTSPLNPSLYALIVATYSALRDTSRTLRYYQQYCEYCVSALSSTASSSNTPSLASPSFSSSTHSAILHSMLRLYALQGDVGMMEGYLGEIVSGGLEDRETMEYLLVGYIRGDVLERVRSVYSRWLRLADGAGMSDHVKDELVRYCVRKGQTTALEQLLHDGVIAAGAEGYGKLIEACCLLTGALDGVLWSYYERMKAAAPSVLSSPAVYAQVFRAVHDRGSLSDKQRALQLIDEMPINSVRLTDEAVVHALLIAIQVGAETGKAGRKSEQTRLLSEVKTKLKRAGNTMRTTQIHALLTALPLTDRRLGWGWARVAMRKQQGANYELMLDTYDELNRVGELSDAKLVHCCNEVWSDLVWLRTVPTPRILQRFLERDVVGGHDYERFIVVYQQAMDICRANATHTPREQVGRLQATAMDVLASKAAAADTTSQSASHVPFLLRAAAVVLRSIKCDTAADSNKDIQIILKPIYSSHHSLLSHLRALLILHTQQSVDNLEPVASMDSRFVRIHVHNKLAAATDNGNNRTISPRNNSGNQRGKSSAAASPQRSTMRTPQLVDALAAADGSGGGRPSVTVYVEHEAAMRYCVEQLDGFRASVEAQDGTWQSIVDSTLHELHAIIEVL